MRAAAAGGGRRAAGGGWRRGAAAVSELSASGRVVDLVLALVALEAGALVWYRRRRGLGVPVGETLAFLGAGACLLLALRATLVGASWEWVAAALAGAGAAHVADLSLRWRPR